VAISEFIPSNRAMEVLKGLREVEAIGPYKLRMRLLVKRDITEGPCINCKAPEEGCNNAIMRLTNCYPTQWVNWSSSLISMCSRLLPATFNKAQLCDVELSQRFCKPGEKPGLEVDLISMLDHVEVVTPDEHTNPEG